jgi:hypothetical protein
MNVETIINITHTYTSYFDRIKYYVMVLIGIVSIFILLSINESKENLLIFVISTSLIFGFLIALKISKNKLYLVDFYSDSKNVKILYLNGSKEYSTEAAIENIKVNLKNTSSRAGFNYEVVLNVGRLKFRINNDFDWDFIEMKQLFEYVKFHNRDTVSEREKSIVSNLESYLKKRPF